MENIYNFSETEMLAFALVLFRILGFVISMPVFGTQSVPVQVKVLFSLSMAFILFPVVGYQNLDVALTDVMAANLAIKEIFVGLVFGYLVRIFFMSLSMAGQIISVSLGVASAQLFNPAFGDSGSSFDQFFMILGTLFFLAIEGHHIFIGGIVDTYRLIPIESLSLDFTSFAQVAGIVQEATAVAIKFAAPVFVTILFTNAAMGLIGRTVPQINILITSLPVNTMVGLFVMFISLPMLIWQMEDLLQSTAEMVFSVMKEL